MELKKIVVGIDDSPRAPEIVQAARVLAERTGARLIFVHAVSLPTGIPHEYYIYPADRMPEVLERDALKLLEKTVRDLPRELILALRPRIGTAWNVLCNIAKEDQADLIVIGSHGYGGIDRILGTTAARVVNHAECSVLVVKPTRS
jgi:nucleotide-binding universal stress UspA family protein